MSTIKMARRCSYPVLAVLVSLVIPETFVSVVKCSELNPTYALPPTSIQTQNQTTNYSTTSAPNLIRNPEPQQKQSNIQQQHQYQYQSQQPFQSYSYTPNNFVAASPANSNHAASNQLEVGEGAAATYPNFTHQTSAPFQNQNQFHAQYSTPVHGAPYAFHQDQNQFPTVNSVNTANAVNQFIDFVPLDYENGQRSEVLPNFKRELPPPNLRGQRAPGAHGGHGPRRRNGSSSSPSTWKNLFSSFSHKFSRMFLTGPPKSRRPPPGPPPKRQNQNPHHHNQNPNIIPNGLGGEPMHEQGFPDYSFLQNPQQVQQQPQQQQQQRTQTPADDRSFSSALATVANFLQQNQLFPALMGTATTTEKGRSMSQDESRFKMGPHMGKRFYGRKPRRKRPHQVHYHHHLDGPPSKHGRGRGRPPPRHRHRPHNDYHSGPPKHKGWRGWKDEHEDSHEDDDHRPQPYPKHPKKEKHRKRPWFFPGKGGDSEEKDHHHPPHKHEDHSPETYYYKESKGYEGYNHKGKGKGKGKDDKAKQSFKFHKVYDYDHGWFDAEKGGSSYKVKEADDHKIQIPKIIINHHHNLPPTGTPGFIPGAFPGPVVGYHPPLHYHERYHATGFPGGLKRDYKSMEMVDPYVVHNHIPPPHPPRPMPGFVPNFVGHAASQPVVAASPLGSNSVMDHFAHNMPNHFMQGKPPMPHMDDVSFGPPNHPNHFPNPNGGMGGDHFPKPNPPPGQDPGGFGGPNHFPQLMNPQNQGGYQGGFHNNNNNFANADIIPANMIDNFEISQDFPQNMQNHFGGNGNENGNDNSPFSNPSDGQEIQNGFGNEEDNFPQPNPPNNPSENFELMSNGQGVPDSASFPSTDDPSNSNEFNLPFTPVPAKGETPPPTRGPATSFFHQNTPGSNHDVPTRSFEFDMIKTLSQGFEIPSQKTGGRNGNFSFPMQSPRQMSNFFDMGVPNRDQYRMKQQQQQKRNKPSHYSNPNNQNSNERPLNRFKPIPNVKVESDELNNYSTLPGSIRDYRPDPSHAKLPRLTYDAFESGSKMQKMRSALHPKSLMKAIFNRFPRGRFMDKKGGKKGGSGNSNFNDDNDESFPNINSAHTKFSPYDAVAKSKDDMNSQRKRRKSNKIPMSIQDIIDSDSNKKEVVSLPEADTNNGDNIDDYGIQEGIIEEEQRRSPLLKRMGEIIIGTPINANKSLTAERRSINSNELQTETPFEHDADVDELGLRSISIPLEAQIQMQGRDYEVAQEVATPEPKKKAVKKKKKKILNISLNSASLISSSAAASRTRHLPQKTSKVEKK